MNTTQIQQLAKRFFSTTIHGITGQEVNEGWLEAGTLIRNLKTWEVGGDELGEIVTKCRFESSTDGGTWHKETSFGVPEVRPWIKLKTRDEEFAAPSGEFLRSASTSARSRSRSAMAAARRTVSFTSSLCSGSFSIGAADACGGSASAS